jgi:hypothetical protein
MPVAGAFVTLLDANDDEVGHTAVDEEGLFLMQAPEPGEYRLRVDQDGYRSSTFPLFTLGPDEIKAFMLLVANLSPPELTAGEVIAQLCGETVPARGVLTGFVYDAVTRAPVGDASVVASWPALSDALAELMERDDIARIRGEVMTDNAGTYVVCGVPANTPVVFHAVSGDRLSDFVQVRIDSSGVWVGDTFHAMTAPLLRRDFQLRTMQPVAGVTVEIEEAGLQTLTNPRGAFRLTALPAGPAQLTVRHLGFRSITRDVELQDEETVAFPPGTFRLETLPPELAPVIVEAERPTMRRPLAEFKERRERGMGDFLTREEWEEDGHPQVPTEVLRRMRGIRIVPCTGAIGGSMRCPGRWWVLTTRGQSRTITGRDPERPGCYPQYYLDGRYFGDASQVAIDDILPIINLEAIEVYTSIAGLPQEFNRPGAACGVIVFWTR